MERITIDTEELSRLNMQLTEEGRRVKSLADSNLSLGKSNVALRLQIKHQRAAFDALIGVGKLTDDEVEAALAFAESLEYEEV